MWGSVEILLYISYVYSTHYRVLFYLVCVSPPCYGVANSVGLQANWAEDIRDNGILVRKAQDELFDKVIEEYRNNL